MTIADKAVLVTGANRGIGRALVEEALRRGAQRVYAGTRQPLAHSDGRVTPLTLDVTNAAQTQAAVERVESLDILINNAGLALYDDLSDRAALEQQLAVNLFGTYGVTQAFLPLLTRSRGAIVNVLSVTAFAALPLIPAYSISKAAAFSLSQSLRALLAGRGVRVHAVLTGPVDTDMSRDLDIPKASPLREPSSTEWRKGRRTSSPIPCHSTWRRVGAAVRPRRSSASMQRLRSPYRCPSQPTDKTGDASANRVLRRLGQATFIDVGIRCAAGTRGSADDQPSGRRPVEQEPCALQC
jgi:NAD(P)-dependent dehydrogenase (short-subunit alcohol dehydrogenase family)